MTPLVVPPANGNDAVITVKVGGDRTSATAVAPLAGVTLGLFTSAGATTPVAGFGTCVSDADGDCSFTVPSTQAGGANRDRQFYVKQITTTTAPGYYTNPTLGTGETVAADAYVFPTAAQLRSGTVYRSTADFMISTGNTNNEASGGIWQQSRDNPTFPAQCGLTVGIVLDLSNSVTDDQLVQLKAAANGLVGALTGTPSRVGTFTFATSAPARAGDTLAPTSVSTAAGASTVTSRISGYAKPGGNAGGTNWDRGLYQVAQSTSHFDVAVVITDGNPTYYGNGEGPGSRTRFREVENGIFSANAVKALGTRVVAFGVGTGVSNAGSGYNLRSISGPTLNSDYYQTASYVQAAAELRTLALGSCAGSVTVVKEVVPPGAPAGTTTGAVPQGGWTFTGAGSTGVTVDAPAARVTADGTGAVNFPLTFSGGTTSGPVTLTETQQSGYTLQQVGGANAVCTRVDTGAVVTVTNVETTGFSVAASSTYPVSCVVYNRAPVPLASVVLHKQWVVNGTTYADGQQPRELVASGSIAGTTVPWEQQQTGFREGDTVSIGEDTDLSGLPLCTLTSARLTGANGATVDTALPSTETLVAGSNNYTITNTVTCDTRLSLTKTVEGGDADPDDWTLTANAPGSAIAGPSGTSGVSGSVTPGVTYPLSESQPHPEYQQFVDPNAVLIPGSTGSWNCQEVEPDGTTVIPGFQDGLNGGVTVPFGRYVRCEAVNRTATLVLRKEVLNTHGGTAGPSDWSLTATPTGDFPAGLTAQTVPGSDDGVSFAVRPGVTYQLTEDGPSGYTLALLNCSIVPGGPGGRSITLEPLDTGTCTFTNADTAAHLTLVKTVTNDDGGGAAPTDWTLTAGGPTPITGATGSAAVTDVSVDAGTYALAESGGQAGYTAGTWSCTAGTLTGASLALAVGEDAVCTIVNDDQPAHLTLVKEVAVGDTGSGKVPTDWTLTATPSDIPGQDAVGGPGGVDEVTVDAGVYELSEDGPAGFDPGGWNCEGGVLGEDRTSVTVPSGGNVICTITNIAVSPTLTLVKQVVNAYGGTAGATDWTLTADGPTPVSGTTGAASVTTAPVRVGTYDLSESGPPGYAASDWACVGASESTATTVTLAEGQDVTCTVTNSDVPSRLTLVKQVVGEGAAAPAAWTLSATGPTSVSGSSGSPDVTDAAVAAGTYDLAESGGPGGYVAGPWLCTGGTIEASRLTIPVGGDATCVVTNTLPGTFDVSKTSDPVSGSTVVPGQTITYTVTARKLAGTDPHDVVVDDDLSAVLSHATFVTGSVRASAGAAVLDGDRLRWTIPTLTGTQTVTYQVVVDDDAVDVTLRNVITSAGSETCAPEPSALVRRPTQDGTAAAALQLLAAPDDPACSTTHTTEPGPTPTPTPTPTTGSSVPVPPATGTTPPRPSPPLATTGGPMLGVGIAGLVLIGLGGVLVLAVRRRQDPTA